MARRDASAYTSKLLAVAAVVVIIAALRFAHEILVPFALAVLLSFLLAPLVARIQRLGVGRALAVMIVVFITFVVMVAGIWVVSRQATELAQNLPTYRQNIVAKLRPLQRWQRVTFGPASQTVEEIAEEVTGTPPSAGSTSDEPSPKEKDDTREAAPLPADDRLATTSAYEAGERGPSAKQGRRDSVKVEVVRETPSAMELLGAAVGSLLKPLGAAALVIVFIIFILVDIEGLRDRFIRLMGYERLNMTTKALNEVGTKVSKYLLMQCVINGLHGVAVGIGLYFLGLPNAFLWGLLTALLRFLPYVGPWMAAGMPMLLSLAIFEDWTRPTIIITFLILVEIVSNNIMEPVLYGKGTGTSPLAILVSAAFWTWLWGAAGLFLATPLTVCLVVIGEHIPRLRFLYILLSDGPVLPRGIHLYQRLLALDRDEAVAIMNQALQSMPPSEFYDQVLIPALAHAAGDRYRGDLDDAQATFTNETIAGFVEEQATRGPADAEAAPSAENGPDGRPSDPPVLCVPAHDVPDALAARMLAHLLGLHRVPARAILEPMLTGELIELVEQEGFELICISALGPSTAQARHLCKRLAHRFPHLQIVVGLWSAGTGRKDIERWDEQGVQIVTSLKQAQQLIGQLQQQMRLAQPTAVGPSGH